jgi:hypothetical protein
LIISRISFFTKKKRKKGRRQVCEVKKKIGERKKIKREKEKGGEKEFEGHVTLHVWSCVREFWIQGESEREKRKGRKKDKRKSEREERERERDRQTDRQTETERERQRERQRETSGYSSQTHSNTPVAAAVAALTNGGKQEQVYVNIYTCCSSSCRVHTRRQRGATCPNSPRKCCCVSICTFVLITQVN